MASLKSKGVKTRHTVNPHEKFQDYVTSLLETQTRDPYGLLLSPCGPHGA